MHDRRGVLERSAITRPFVVIEDDFLEKRSQGRCFAIRLAHIAIDPPTLGNQLLKAADFADFADFADIF